MEHNSEGYIAIEALIKKYIDNTITAAELGILHGIFSNPAYEVHLKAVLENVWNTIPEDAQLRAGHRKLLAENIKAAIADQERPVRSQANLYWRMAAVILLLIISSFLLFQNTIRDLVYPPQLTEIYTKAGERTKVILPDGTTVWLNAQSHLTYPDRFKYNSRNIALTGEAFFNVTPNTDAPFTITTGDLQTTVLGTSFNIRSYSDEPFRMTVATGKVQVKSATQTIRVNALQQTTYIPGRGFSAVETVAPDEAMAWTEGTLVLNNKTFEEVAHILERWYNVKITFTNDTLRNCKLMGEYTHQSLPAVLHALQFILGFEYEEHNGTIVIRGDGC